MLFDYLIFFAGVVMLVAGAWALVTGGSRLASALGVPPILVGLTVVAWGTSVPELVVSMMAAARGSSGMMLGNIMGSNVANVGLILGTAALMMSPPNDRSLWRLELPALLLGTALFAVFCLNGVLGRAEGMILMALFAWVTFRTISSGLQKGRVNRQTQEAESEHSPSEADCGIIIAVTLTVVGAAALVVGGKWIVDSATRIAAQLGASEVVIGLTLVAVGTSLPELATTLVAAMRRESGIALGNVVGSNLFNLLAVGGPVAVWKTVDVDPSLMTREIPSLGIMTLALVAVSLTRHRINRVAGVFLIVLYAAMVTWWIA